MKIIVFCILWIVALFIGIAIRYAIEEIKEQKRHKQFEETLKKSAAIGNHLTGGNDNEI
jgi:hypothetical protein